MDSQLYLFQSTISCYLGFNPIIRVVLSGFEYTQLNAVSEINTFMTELSHWREGKGWGVKGKG